MSKRTIIKLLFGFILSVVIVYFSIISLGGLDMIALFRIDVDWGLVMASILIFVYSNYIRGLAYSHGIDRSMDKMTAFQIVGIGHALNMVLPLHLGEGLRAIFFPNDYSAIRRTKLLVIPAFADFVAIMVLALISVPFAGFKDQNLLAALWILSLTCVLTILVAVFLILYIPRLRGYFSEYLNAGLIYMMVYTMLSWVLLLLSMWIGMLALGSSFMESIQMALAVFTATNLINFIPASPGAIGLFEYATVMGLGGLEVEKTRALSIGLVQHMIQYAALLPLGVFLYIMALKGKLGSALREMWKLKRRKGGASTYGDEK